MILRKQPGCWLRSSHSFKECVIAHWSSGVARKITGAKLYTEFADCSMFNNVYYMKRNFLLRNAKHFQTKWKKEKHTQEVMHIIKRATVVEEHSIVGRR